MNNLDILRKFARPISMTARIAEIHHVLKPIDFIAIDVDDFHYVIEDDEQYSPARIAGTNAIKTPSLKATNKKMPQSLFKMLVHVVFSTKNRADLIAPAIENDLFGYMSGIVKNNDARLIIANGTANHVHLLISLPKKIDIAALVGDIERDTSKWMKTDKKIDDFYWQSGYGAFSIGQSQVEILINYIKRQKEHHDKQNFKDEYRAILRKYEIDYDEQYVWD